MRERTNKINAMRVCQKKTERSRNKRNEKINITNKGTLGKFNQILLFDYLIKRSWIGFYSLSNKYLSSGFGFWLFEIFTTMIGIMDLNHYHYDNTLTCDV
jgi:hypothetical protein